MISFRLRQRARKRLKFLKLKNSVALDISRYGNEIGNILIPSVKRFANALVGVNKLGKYVEGVEADAD